MSDNPVVVRFTSGLVIFAARCKSVYLQWVAHPWVRVPFTDNTSSAESAEATFVWKQFAQFGS